MLIVMVYTLRHSKQTIALQKHMSFRYHFLLIISFVFATFSQAQSIEEPLAKYNKETVPYILVDALKKDMSKYLILDTRKKLCIVLLEYARKNLVKIYKNKDTQM